MTEPFRSRPADPIDRALRELRVLRHALEQSGLLVWSARADGFVDYVSLSFARFCGLPRATLIGPGCRALMPEGELAASAERWRIASESGEGYRARVTLRDAGGGLVPHAIRLTPLQVQEGAVTRWVGTARPVGADGGVAQALALAPMSLARLVSPLTGRCARAEACGPPEDEGLWWHVRERDGTPYVASARWLRAVAKDPPCDADLAQALLAARYYASLGTPLALVAPADKKGYEASPPAVPTVPWAIGR